MSDTQLVVLSLADEESAKSLVRQLDAIAKLDDNVKIVDAALAAKSGRGKPKLKQLKVSSSTRGGFVGAIGGAFAGLASLFHDAGIDDDMMRRTAEDLAPGEVALFLLYTGSWRRSNVVLQDALTAHGIRYIDPRRQNPTLARIRPETTRRRGAPAQARTSMTEAEAEVETPAQAETEDEPVFGEEPEPEFVEEPHFVEEPEPVFGEESVEEMAGEDTAEYEAAAADDPVADAARAAMIAAAADEARAADAGAYADEVAALSEAAGEAGVADTLQGEEMLAASTQVGEASARISLLSLERRYGGLEVGRIAGELAEIGRELGEQDLPLLSALLASRSGMLQRIAAEMVASAASARELASVLEETGSQVGELGAAEVDEGSARLAVASALAAQAAQEGAGGLTLKETAAQTPK